MQRNAGASSARYATRTEASSAHRTLDESTRNRRLKRQLDALDLDNAHEDPHANLVWHKNIPKFEDEDLSAPGSSKKMNAGEPSKKKRRFRTEHKKSRFRKNFAALLEDESAAKKDEPRIAEAFKNATAPPSKIPPRHFCAVCGFSSKYTCIRCGARYCCIRCCDTHNETRCLKWTA